MVQPIQILEACMAVAALIAKVDGWVSEEERAIVARLTQAMPHLSADKVEDALRIFHYFLDALGEDDGGTAEIAWSAVEECAAHPEVARSVLAFARAIALADSALESEEGFILRMICVHLKLDPAEMLG